MKSLLKISKLKLIGIAVIAPVLIGGTVVAYNIVTPVKTTNNTTHAEQATTSDKSDNQTNASEQAEDTPTDQTATESTTSTQTQASTPKPAATQPAQTNTTTTPQQTTTAPTPTAPTCNESMKSSYTNLYNSKVASENANWNNQISAWQADAQRRGLGFSGYVQGMINDNKPAHDARLAQLQTQYYQNLASVNCSP
jgi:cell division septation protein DedD